jgi:glycosyltransferase 2 family protein
MKLIEFKKKISNIKIFKSRKLMMIGKWFFFIILIGLTLAFSDIDEISRLITNIPAVSFIYYVLVLFIGRILYAYRWKRINDLLAPEFSPNLMTFFSTNLLAEFFSIALPSSLGGEAIRYLKINQFNKDGIATTLAIFLDRLIGIGTMVMVSFVALLMINQTFRFDIEGLIPRNLVFPLIGGGFIITSILLFVFFKYLRRKKIVEKIQSASVMITKNWKSFIGVMAISILSHIIFSLSHVVLFNIVNPLPIIYVVGVILTPQLARSIPISILGVSGGEGLMVFSQLLAGLSQNEAIVITALSLLARYVFALIGLLIELYKDGTSIFNKDKINP